MLLLTSLLVDELDLVHVVRLVERRDASTKSTGLTQRHGEWMSVCLVMVVVGHFHSKTGATIIFFSPDKFTLTVTGTTVPVPVVASII